MVTVLNQLYKRVECMVSHKDIPASAMLEMDIIRQQFIDLASVVAATCPEGRSKSLCLTYLEDALMRAIQSLALQGVPDVNLT